MADGEITFSTALDNEQLEKELKRAEREVKGLEDKVSKWSGDKSAIEKQIDSANAAIAETEAHIESLKARLASFPDVTSDAATYRENRDAMMQIGQQIEAANAKMAEQIEQSDKLNRQWQTADEKARGYTQQLEGAKRRSAEIGAEYSKAMKGVKESTAKATKDAETRFGKLQRHINELVKSAFVFTVIASALSAVKEHLADTAKENDRFAVAMANLKATMAGFAAPLVNGAVAALTGLMNMISKMLDTLAGMIDSVFRTNLAGSIKAAREAAQAAEREAKAKKKTAKAAKEATKSIMAFDEINALSADKDAEKDEEEEQPLDWNALDAGKIDEKLGAIMLILGAALMAVGAILAFSGINIPLGLTLMAIGALMVYTAAKEQWGALPAQLQSAITTALALTGIALLVIGAILVFSGAGLPIGVGMMVAGALLICTAIGLNWGSMAPQMQAVCTLIMAVLGAALLVVGAVLAFSGAATPLGIGLMVAGAAMIGMAAALAWTSLPDEMRNTVGAIMLVLGGVLVVVGAILAFSGAAIPLGVGLMIAGAALLAAGAATVNWQSMPQEVGNVVSIVLGIIGGALIVVGIVLLFTGAGIPLGIGCILAGIGSLAGAAAVNWNFLGDKIKEIWDGIVSWWNSNVAQVFTAEFWENLWKGMVNGLIMAVNWCIDQFSSFLNWIGGGIAQVGSFVGQDWSFNVSFGHLPYLAQGAVIPPNRKFAAVLGDQTSGYNLEAPEGLIRQIVREEAGGNAWEVQQGVAAALMQVLPALLGGESGGDVVLQLVVGNEELARAVNKGNASMARRGAVNPGIAFA